MRKQEKKGGTFSVEKFHAVNILWDEVTPIQCGKASMEPRNILLPQVNLFLKVL